MKWTVIALYNAVQAYMVVALEGSAGERTYKAFQAERLIAARQEHYTEPWKLGRNLPLEDQYSFDHFLEDVPIRKKKMKPPPDIDELKLKEFLGLYEGIQDAEQMGDYGDYSHPFVPGNGHTASMKRLNEFRNTFIHFVPSTHIEFIGDLPTVVQHSVDVIEFLTFESGLVGWKPRARPKRTKALINTIRAEAQCFERIYSGEES